MRRGCAAWRQKSSAAAASMRWKNLTLPRLVAQSGLIQMILEEREHEDHFRLKMDRFCQYASVKRGGRSIETRAHSFWIKLVGLNN